MYTQIAYPFYKFHTNLSFCPIIGQLLSFRNRPLCVVVVVIVGVLFLKCITGAFVSSQMTSSKLPLCWLSHVPTTRIPHVVVVVVVIAPWRWGFLCCFDKRPGEKPITSQNCFHSASKGDENDYLGAKIIPKWETKRFAFHLVSPFLNGNTTSSQHPAVFLKHKYRSIRN